MINQKKLRDTLRIIKKKIRENPKVLARFDKDGNGVIDGQEWEEVRQLAIRRLERIEREQAVAQQTAQQADPETLSSAQQSGSSQNSLTMDMSAATSAMTSGIVNEDLTEFNIPADAQLGTIAQARQLILEEEGSIGKMILSTMVCRKYEIKNGRNQVLARIEQSESEFMQSWKTRTLFEIPDLDFRLFETASANAYTFRRSQAIAKDRIDVLNSKGAPIAHARWTFSLIARTYELYSSFSTDKLILKQPLLRPFTMFLYDHKGNEIGMVEKGWSGLGAFLTGGNRMRIRFQRPQAVSEGHRWAILACCLLEDLNNEERNRD